MTARTGMAEIISDLRLMTETGTSDYVIADTYYWSNDQLQRILDTYRTDLKWYQMTAYEEGDSSYLDYSIGYANIEQTTGGTAIFMVQDLNGATVLSPSYSVNYKIGLVTFASDTGGTDYWVTGRSFDLNKAAADVWRKKQSHYARAVDFSTDGHNISRAQLYEHAKQMSEFYELQGGGGFGTMDIMRSDTDG